MRSLTWREVWRRRLASHFLDTPMPAGRMADVVRRVSGIHAQVMPAAEVSLALRLAGATRQDVRAELWERRGLVRTYGLRGTVHLFPADELPMWTAALRVGRLAQDKQRLAKQGLDADQTDAIVQAIQEALLGRCLTREELGREIAHRVGSWALNTDSLAWGGGFPQWQLALGVGATLGALCFGPNQGTKATFVRPDEWIGAASEVDGTGALREIVRRYLTTYGPATHAEFAQWFGVLPGAASELFHGLAEELEEVDVDGQRAWLLAGGDTVSQPPAESSVHLLPHFDCYVVGCHPRSQLAPTQYARRVFPGGSAGNVPVLLIDGVVAGIWQHRRSGHRIEIRVEAFEGLNARQYEELEKAVVRVGEIVEAEPILTFCEIEARRHL